MSLLNMLPDVTFIHCSVYNITATPLMHPCLGVVLQVEPVQKCLLPQLILDTRVVHNVAVGTLWLGTCVSNTLYEAIMNINDIGLCVGNHDLNIF